MGCVSSKSKRSKRGSLDDFDDILNDNDVLLTSFSKDFYSTNHQLPNNTNAKVFSSFALDFYENSPRVTNTASPSTHVHNHHRNKPKLDINTTATATTTTTTSSSSSNTHPPSSPEQQKSLNKNNHDHRSYVMRSLYKLPDVGKSYTYKTVHRNVKEHLRESSTMFNTSGVVGLRNLGNTCFMNSSLQCLSNTIPLTDYFLGYDYRSEINATNFLGTGGKLASAYAELMKEIWLGGNGGTNQMKKKNNPHNRSVTPRNFKSTLEKFAPQFRGYHQHDAQELLAFLLDGIHEDLNRVTEKPYVEDKDCDGTNDYNDAILSWKNYLLRNRSIIVDLFQGQLRNSLQCEKCQHTSVKFEPFMYLSLPIDTAETTKKNLTLNDCVELYCRQEVLKGDNLWYCPNCQNHVSCLKKLDLWALPPILIIHLKRFKITEPNQTRIKLRNSIEFPIRNWNIAPLLKNVHLEKPIYDLYAISNHVGDLSSGHYTAEALNRIDNTWHDFNDSKCENLQDYSKRSVLSSSSAYCLFYNRVTKERSSSSVRQNSSTRNGCENAEGDEDDDDEDEDDNKNIGPATLIRRQTIRRPELWPHMQSSDSCAEF